MPVVGLSQAHGDVVAHRQLTAAARSFRITFPLLSSESKSALYCRVFPEGSARLHCERHEMEVYHVRSTLHGEVSTLYGRTHHCPDVSLLWKLMCDLSGRRAGFWNVHECVDSD